MLRCFPCHRLILTSSFELRISAPPSVLSHLCLKTFDALACLRSSDVSSLAMLTVLCLTSSPCEMC